MTTVEIQQILDKQRNFFLSGATLALDTRIDYLKKMKSNFIKYENEINQAVRKDMGRNEMETYLMEIHSVIDETTNAIKNLRTWAKEQRVKSPTMFLANTSLIKPEPLGTVFILSAWNFPTWQIFGPLLGAIAAGNTAVVRPSYDSRASCAIIQKIISETFPPEYVYCVLGDTAVVNLILEERFDLIFFTGSPRVGKMIQAAAAKFLTPTILELGGKSPAIVDQTADIDQAAKRVVWGKLFNTGQICVSVDHVYVHQKVKKEFIEHCKKHIIAFYGEDASRSPDYGFIINERNYKRLVHLMNAGGNVVFGGNYNAEKRFIAPTIIDGITEVDEIMQEEIFGPILPVLEFENIDTLIQLQKRKEKPLALYIFSKNSKTVNNLLAHTSSGGVTINDCMQHGASRYLPFGGVGNSGMGNYVGEASFKAFTHFKPVMKANTAHALDVSLRYPPYDGKVKKLKSIYKLID